MSISIKTPKQRLVGIFTLTFLILLVPFIAMHFTDEVQWNGFDFFVAAVLLISTLLSIEGVFRLYNSRKKRLFFIVALILILLIVWVELAVGIFGTPFAGN